MQRFLIIQTAFIGDVILMTPLISELHRIYPDAQIDVLVRKGNESLLANNSKIHSVLVWNKKESKNKELFRIIKEVRKVKYTETFTLQRYFSGALITLFARARRKTGFEVNSLPWIYTQKFPHSLLSGKHEVERNLSLIAHHGAKHLIRPELFPSKEDRDNVGIYQQEDYFCIAPSSVWKTKMLPIYKWKEVIQNIQEKGKIYLLGGPGDFELCQQLVEVNSEKVINLAGKLSFLESAVLMEKAKMNFVNDSGPLHIASAMNAPTRAFFLSTVPKFGFYPLAENSKVIQTSLDLDCRPCGFHGHNECPAGHFKCAHSIDVSLDNLEL